jgi:Ca2+-binding RTX toxin-like protein
VAITAVVTALASVGATKAQAAFASLDVAANTGAVASLLVRQIEDANTAEGIVVFRHEELLSDAASKAPQGPRRAAVLVDTLRTGLADRKQRALADAGNRATVLREYPNLPASLVRFDSLEALLAVARHPAVAGVAANGTGVANLEQSLPLVRQPHAAAAGFTGAGTETVVIDDGVNLAAFDGCPGTACPISETVDYRPDDTVDNTNHGTNVAAIATGVAPHTRIVSMDVSAWNATARRNRSQHADVLDALDGVLERVRAGRNIRAVNMSFGMDDPPQYFTTECTTDPNGDPNPYTGAFKELRSVRVLPVVSAGNAAVTATGFRNGIGFPACTPGAVSVGATYDFAGTFIGSCTDTAAAPDRPACFSQSAPILTMLAPGAWITAATLTYAGTSQAAPHVAGAAAVLGEAAPTASTLQVQYALAETGTPITDARNGVTKRRLQLCSALRWLLARSVCASVTRSGGNLAFTAGAGQANDLTISLASGVYTVTDAGVPIDPGTACSRVTESTVTCPASGVSRLTISAGDGNDRVSVTAATPTMITGGPGADVLHGGPVADHLVADESGMAGRDTLYGNSGNDILEGGLGADVISGGTGRDEVRYESDGRIAGVTVRLDDAANDGSAWEGDNVRADVENIRGSVYDDDLTGQPTAPSSVWGGNGQDTLRGGGYADLLNGEGGADLLYGNAGADILDGGNDNDVLHGGADRDHLLGGYGRDDLAGEAGPDRLDGGPGDDPLEALYDAGDLLSGGTGEDEADYSTHDTGVWVQLDDLANDGAGGGWGEHDFVTPDVENLTGSDQSDLLAGNASANRISGRDGSDWMYGLAGEDVLNSRDGEIDETVNCGSDLDFAIVDPGDPVVGCESV